MFINIVSVVSRSDVSSSSSLSESSDVGMIDTSDCKLSLVNLTALQATSKEDRDDLKHAANGKDPSRIKRVLKDPGSCPCKNLFIT